MAQIVTPVINSETIVIPYRDFYRCSCLGCNAEFSTPAYPLPEGMDIGCPDCGANCVILETFEDEIVFSIRIEGSSDAILIRGHDEPVGAIASAKAKGLILGPVAEIVPLLGSEFQFYGDKRA